MFDFSKIGMRPSYSENFGLEATEEQIIELEKHCGHYLPENYKYILKKYNGGEPEAKDFDVVDEESEVPLGYELSDFYVVNDHKELPVNIWWAIKNYSELIGPNTLPFASDGYNCIYYFKWNGDTPQVWVLILMSEEAPDTHFLLNSFEELLGSLYNAD